MKKALAFLLAFALVGGLLFAQGAAPQEVKLADPTITFGVTSYFGMNVLTDNAILGYQAGATDQSFISDPLFGGLPTDNYYWTGYNYHVNPFVRIAQGPFSARLDIGFLGDATATLARRYDLTLGIAGTGYSFTNRYRVQVGTSVVASQLIVASVTKDNLSAAVALSGSQTVDLTAQEVSYTVGTDTYRYWKQPVSYFEQVLLRPLFNATLQDFRFEIKDLLKFVDVKIGGYSNSYYHTNTYRYTAIGSFMWRSSSNVNQGFRWKGTLTTNVPVNTTFNFGKLIPDLALTLRTGINVPVVADEVRDFLLGNNMILSAEYKLPNVGKFVIGCIPAFSYTAYLRPVADYLKVVMRTTNTVFFDANLSLVENLSLQAAFDYRAQTFTSQDPAATTGTGTAADPRTTALATETTINFGIEAIYDLSAAVKGLSVEAAFAFANKSGRTSLNDTGTAWTAPTTGPNIYNNPNYTEANVYGALANLVFGIGVSYALDDNNSISFTNTYTNMAGEYEDVDAGAINLTTRGFYNTNTVTLGYALTAGKGIFNVDFGYTMYLGLPTAADYQLTTPLDIETYKRELANTYKPLSLTIKYTASF